MVFTGANLMGMNISLDVTSSHVKPISRIFVNNRVIFGVADDKTSVMMLAGVEAMRTIQQCEIPRQPGSESNTRCAMMINNNEVLIEDVAANADATNDEKDQAAGIIANRVTGLRIIVDLTQAMRHCRLEEKHVDSYLLSKKVEGYSSAIILRVVRLVYCYIPDLVDEPNGAEHFTYNDWMKYRLTFSSTAHLVQRADQHVRALCPNMFSIAERTRVTDSINQPHNQTLNGRIDNLTIAKAYYILNQMGELPQDWYQGKKAIMNVNADAINSIKNAVNYWNNIRLTKRGTDTIDNTEDLELYVQANSLIPGQGIDQIATAKEVLEPVLSSHKLHRSWNPLRRYSHFINLNYILISIVFFMMAYIIRMI